MKQKAAQKLTGLLIVACMLIAQPFCCTGVSAAEAMPEKMTDDVLTCQSIEIETSALAESPISIYGGTSSFGSSSAVNADETAYEEDCYASYAGYDALNSDQQKIYNKLKESAHTFYTSTNDAQSINYSDGSMEYFAAVNNSFSALTAEDIAEVISMFRSDNPIYFFVGSYMLYSTTTVWGSTYISQIYVSCMDEYTDGTVRQEEREVLENTISQVRASMTGCTTALEYATAAHDWIRDTITYAFDANGNPEESMTAHSIVGVFDSTYNRAVCEGYSKAFQLLLNAAGVENYYVVGLGNGGGHAWNMARMDDGFFYYFDVTWDDSANTSEYFAAGKISFSQEHTAFTTDKTSWEFLYDLPDVPETAYSGAVGTSYAEGDFVYELFDTYAALTDYSGSAESVSVPETTNGLPVTQIKGAFADHANLQKVLLPSTVTVISYGEQGVGAFENCVSLKIVSMPAQLKRVEFRSFLACSALEVITIPASVTQIGACAFYGCNSLGQIFIYAPSCKLVSQSTIYADTTIYGYADSTAETYATAYSRNFAELNGVSSETTTSLTTTTTTTTSNTTTTTTTEPAAETTTETTHTTETSTTASASTTETQSMTTTASVTSDSVLTTTGDTATVLTEVTTEGTTETTAASTTETTPVLVADINQDGGCALNDLVLMNQYLIQAVEISPAQLVAMDCYRDGTVDTKDSTSLLKFLVRLIPELPVQPEETVIT